MILSTVKYDNARLSSALRSTVTHRGTEEILENWSSGLKRIKDSKTMSERWAKYCREFSYAKGILFDDVCEKIHQVLMTVL